MWNVWFVLGLSQLCFKICPLWILVIPQILPYYATHYAVIIHYNHYYHMRSLRKSAQV